jgi:predicted acyl esterase
MATFTINNFFTRLSCQRISMLLCTMLLATPASAQQATADRSVVGTTNVEVVMRDGVTISLDIYRPAQSGQYPTLYAAGPYPPAGDALPPDTPETGPVAWLVSQGYNYVLASVRGTGSSAGSFGLFSREEQQDHYEIIEWIATQGWSNGQVAGVGAGYYGSSQWQMAIQNPPHLNCIAPVDGITDPYRDWARRGGLENSDFLLWYEQRVRDAHAFPAQGSPRHIDLDLRLEQLRHPMRDEFWTTRSAMAWFDQIRVPIFVIGSMTGGRYNDTQVLRNLSALPGPTRVLLLKDGLQLQDQALLENELLPFYSWCFNGPPAQGHPEKPLIRIARGNQENLLDLSAWPPASVRFAPLYLTSTGTTGNTTGVLTTTTLPGSNRDTVYGESTVQPLLTFKSAELAADLELVGPLVLELYASTSGTDTAFDVELLEEETLRQIPDPQVLPTFPLPGKAVQEPLTAARARLVSSGRLKASARTLRTPLAEDFQADYAFDRAAPLAAGRVYRIDLVMDPVAHRFRAGNRLLLRLRQTQDASLRTSVRQDNLHHSGQYPSRLHLPVLPDQTLPSSEPTIRFTATTPIAKGSGLEGDAALLFDTSNPVILLP